MLKKIDIKLIKDMINLVFWFCVFVVIITFWLCPVLISEHADRVYLNDRESCKNLPNCVIEGETAYIKDANVRLTLTHDAYVLNISHADKNTGKQKKTEIILNTKLIGGRVRSTE